MEVYEYRIVKIEKGLFLIEYNTAPYGVWHEVKTSSSRLSQRQNLGQERTFNKRCRYDHSIINHIHSYRHSIYVCRHKNL